MPPAKMNHPMLAANRVPDTKAPTVSASRFSVQSLVQPQTPTGPGERTTREKHSWRYSSDRTPVLIDHPLGPDADGQPVTPALLTAAGYDPTPSWRKEGDFWTLTVYEKTGGTQSLLVVSTPCSDHFLVADGFPAAIDAMTKLSDLIGDKSVGPARNVLKKKK